jgi:hypothetical protein
MILKGLFEETEILVKIYAASRKEKMPVSRIDTTWLLFRGTVKEKT